MHKTKLALIGAGTIGKRHLKALSDVEEADLTAVVDTNPKLEKLALDRKVPFFTSTKEMLREREPEGVIVCTPTEVHLAPVLSSLESKAHVLVEKPITATLAEGRKIIESAEKASREVLVGHQ